MIRNKIREPFNRIVKIRLPIIAATALVGITGQALNLSFSTCLTLVVLAQTVLVLLSLKP